MTELRNNKVIQQTCRVFIRLVALSKWSCFLFHQNTSFASTNKQMTPVACQKMFHSQLLRWKGVGSRVLGKALSCCTCQFLWQTHSPGPIFTCMKIRNMGLTRNANNQLLQANSSPSLDIFPAHMLSWQTGHILLGKTFSLPGDIQNKALAQ